MTYPVRKKYRGKGEYERQAIRDGHPPEFTVGQRARIVWTDTVGKITALELRIVDPPTWRFEIDNAWYFAADLRSA